MGPLVQNFSRGGNLLLSVSAPAHIYFSISSLAWYHNGIEVTPGESERLIIDSRGTRLNITNMEGSDAGMYQVKINSTSFNFMENSASCDEITLPTLEPLAIHAPVTFTVQEQHTPTYNPSRIVSNIYILKDVTKLELVNTLNPPNFGYSMHTSHWFKNGRGIFKFNSNPDQLTRSLQAQSGSSSGLLADYIGAFWIMSNYFDQHFQDTCSGYVQYLGDNYPTIPLKVSYMSVKIYSKSS